MLLTLIVRVAVVDVSVAATVLTGV